MNKVYVGNLVYSATSKDLINLFSEYGQILEAMIIPDKNEGGKSKGYGFVTFASQDALQRALDLNGKEYQGRKLVVEKSKSEPEENLQQSETIYQA